MVRVPPSGLGKGMLDKVRLDKVDLSYKNNCHNFRCEKNGVFLSTTTIAVTTKTTTAILITTTTKNNNNNNNNDNNNNNNNGNALIR